MTEAPESAAGPAADDGKPRSFMVWTGKRHVFKVRAPENYWLVAAVKLIGDVPAIHHDVRILDPDTGDPVGDPATTDEDGVLRVEVPENKEYRIELADPEPEHANAPPLIHEPDEHAMLRVEFVRASGDPLAGAEVHAKFGDSEMLLTTDEEGRIESPAHLGPYELSIGDQTFHAHSLPPEDAEKDEAIYHFLVEATPEEGEALGSESSESAPAPAESPDPDSGSGEDGKSESSESPGEAAAGSGASEGAASGSPDPSDSGAGGDA